MTAKTDQNAHPHLLDVELLGKGKMVEIVYDQFARLFDGLSREWSVDIFFEKVLDIIRLRDNAFFEDPYRIFTHIVFDAGQTQVNDVSTEIAAFQYPYLAIVYWNRAYNNASSPTQKHRMRSYIADAYYWHGRADPKIQFYLDNHQKVLTKEQLESFVRLRDSGSRNAARPKSYDYLRWKVLNRLGEKAFFGAKRWPDAEPAAEELYYELVQHENGKLFMLVEKVQKSKRRNTVKRKKEKISIRGKRKSFIDTMVGWIKNSLLYELCIDGAKKPGSTASPKRSSKTDKGDVNVSNQEDYRFPEKMFAGELRGYSDAPRDRRDVEHYIKSIMLQLADCYLYRNRKQDASDVVHPDIKHPVPGGLIFDQIYSENARNFVDSFTKYIQKIDDSSLTDFDDIFWQFIPGGENTSKTEPVEFNKNKAQIFDFLDPEKSIARAKLVGVKKETRAAAEKNARHKKIEAAYYDIFLSGVCCVRAGKAADEGNHDLAWSYIIHAQYHCGRATAYIIYRIRVDEVEQDFRDRFKPWASNNPGEKSRDIRDKNRQPLKEYLHRLIEQNGIDDVLKLDKRQKKYAKDHGLKPYAKSSIETMLREWRKRDGSMKKNTKP
ncbi:hypothetical protein LJC19_05795 [Oxalobacter sp. OttesenSCG-928-P03]|nr:hypothetical protein [Oxalobacter sp. OttesenSCG-928-P03]